MNHKKMSLIFCTYQTLKNIFNSFLRLLPSTRSIDNFPENVFFGKKKKTRKNQKFVNIQIIHHFLNYFKKSNLKR